MIEILKVTWHILCDKNIMKKALYIALVVGTILNFINQGDYIVGFMFDKINFYKLSLTYCVPFLVSTYTAISMKMKFHIGEKAIISTTLYCKGCGEKMEVEEKKIIPECSKCGLYTHWNIKK